LLEYEVDVIRHDPASACSTCPCPRDDFAALAAASREL